MQEVVALLVDRVEARDRQAVRVVWTLAARPPFAAHAADVADGGCVTMAPPDGLEGAVGKSSDALEWYAGGMDDQPMSRRTPTTVPTTMINPRKSVGDSRRPTIAPT